MIDRDIQARAEAFRGNQPQLLQRFKQSNDLIDLLALQKLKSEKEAAVRDMQMQQAQAQQKQGGLPTIAQQREQQVMELTKGELLQQQQGVLAKKQADQQNAIRRLVSSGVGSLPAPNMARMMGGGIVGYQEGGPIDEEDARRKALIQELIRQNREASSQYLSEGSLGLESARNLDAEDPVFTMEEMGYNQGGPIEGTPQLQEETFRGKQAEALAMFLDDPDNFSQLVEGINQIASRSGLPSLSGEEATDMARAYNERMEFAGGQGSATPRAVTDTGTSPAFSGYIDPYLLRSYEEAEEAEEAALDAGIAAFDDGNTFLDRLNSTPIRTAAESIRESSSGPDDGDTQNKIESLQGDIARLEQLLSRNTLPPMTRRSSTTQLARLKTQLAELLGQSPEGQQRTPEEQEQAEGEYSLALQDEINRMDEINRIREAEDPVGAADLDQFTVERVDEETVDERNPITRAMGSLSQDKLDQLISFLGSAGTGTSVASALRTGAAGAQATKAEQAAIERALSEAAAERAQERELTQLGLDTAEKQFLSGLLRETQQAVAMNNMGRDEAIGRLRGDLNRIVYEFTTTNPEYLDAARRKDTERMTALVTAVRTPILDTIASLESGKYDVTEAMKLLLEYYE